MRVSSSLKCLSVIAIFSIVFSLGESSSIGRPGIRPRPELSTKPLFTVIHPKDDDRIVGGLEAKNGQFPYQVSIQNKFTSSSSHYCGGSYISSNYVVTAAHCMRGRNAANILVKGGSIDFAEAVTSKVAEIVVHPDYDPQTVTNDIALLKLETPVSFSDNIAAIRIPELNQVTPETTSCFVSGWGTTEEGGSLPNKLRFVDVNTLSDQSCRDQYGESEIADSMICAGYPEGQKDSCQGDSGGPLSCSGELVGIVSWGYGCARPNYAGVYTEVAYFADWIEKQITPTKNNDIVHECGTVV